MSPSTITTTLEIWCSGRDFNSTKSWTSYVPADGLFVIDSTWFVDQFRLRTQYVADLKIVRLFGWCHTYLKLYGKFIINICQPLVTRTISWKDLSTSPSWCSAQNHIYCSTFQDWQGHSQFISWADPNPPLNVGTSLAKVKDFLL